MEEMSPGTCWDNNEEAEEPCVVLLTLMKLKIDTHKHMSVTISVRTLTRGLETNLTSYHSNVKP